MSKEKSGEKGKESKGRESNEPRIVPRMISVNLGWRGIYELSASADGERVLILVHGSGDGPQLIGEFPVQLVPSIQALVETYEFHTTPVNVQPTQPRTIGEVVGAEVATASGLDPNRLAHPVTVEKRTRPDGKVDTIVTPHGLQAGPEQGKIG